MGNVHKFTTRLTTPFKGKITCAAKIDGDTMTGNAKAAITSITFTGTW